ncbi:MAG: transcription regulator AraC family [Clostridia bacterium]|jgi:AraC-like DNA-binding protein|nr:transcription regulator AraC family [Clostridia bacterium]
MSLHYFKIGTSNLLEVKICQEELHAYKAHLHEELSIGFIERGATNVSVNGTNYYIKEKEAIVIYPFVSHKCQPVDLKNWEFTMIYINENFYHGILNDLNEKHFLGIRKLEDQEYKKVKQMISTIKSNQGLAEKEETIVETLAEIFIRCDIDIEIVKDEGLQEIREYIEMNFLEQLKLDDLEKYFGFNKFRIIRSFKNKYNVSPRAYQLQLKVNYAKHLISRGEGLVEAALKAGFYDQAHFTKEFKKAYGITPRQYINM